MVQLTRHRASMVINADVDELFEWLCQVEHWTQFIEGLDSVESLGFRRYRWQATYAGRVRTCDMAVSLDPREHRFAWRHQHGPAFDGTLRLTAVGDRRTRVDMSLHVEPTGILDGFIGTTNLTGWMVEHDLHRLRELVRDGALRRPSVVDSPSLCEQEATG